MTLEYLCTELHAAIIMQYEYQSAPEPQPDMETSNVNHSVWFANIFV